MTTAASSRVWRLLLRGYLVVLPLSTKGLNIEHSSLPPGRVAEVPTQVGMLA